MPPQKTITELEQEVVEEFELFDDWMERYEHLIELGRSLPLIEDAYKTEAYRIHGCQSQVWIRGDAQEGRVSFKADSDALITKGLIALLLRVLNGQPPKDIVQADLGFLDQIGMKEHLSPTRKNGLGAMVKRIKHYALAFDENTSAPQAYS